MRTIIKCILPFLVLLLTACEDVIDVPVQTAPTRLVIEASLDWEKGGSGNVQRIQLSTSTAFFDTQTHTVATGAIITVTNDVDGAVVNFIDQGDGAYTTDAFVPVLGQSYTLDITYEGEAYRATETLHAVPEITDLFQDREDGFDDEELELHVVFMDPPEEGNNYLFAFQREGDLLPELEVGYDDFVNGNEIDWWYEIEGDGDDDTIEVLAPGDEVAIEMYGISRAYRDYMEILIDQIGGVGLFEATPVSVKGNCVNLTNPENYAHGYFRVTEVNKTTYTFE